MKKIRSYILPMSASDGMDGLDSLLGNMDAGTIPDTGATLDTSVDDVDNTVDNTDDNTDDTTSQTQAQQASVPDTKQAHAFAELRQQNAAFKQLLGKLATANGIQYSNEQDLVNAINDDTIAKLAQKQNVPVELLKRMETLEQDSAALQQTRLKDAAFIGFQNVMTQYGLKQEELQAFAKELDEAGKNPFMNKVDLVAEYKTIHFDDILNKRVQAAVQEALTKSNNADVHSSTPNKQVGGGNSTNDKITTVSGLNSLLAEMK